MHMRCRSDPFRNVLQEYEEVWVVVGAIKDDFGDHGVSVGI